METEDGCEGKLAAIAAQFSSSVKQITSLGNGLINDTYRVDTGSDTLVLQRINRQVFPEPVKIMSNLGVLSAHLRAKCGHPVDLQFPELVFTLSGDTHVIAGDDVWRALKFIGHTESLETVRDLSDAYQTGLALGRFHRLFSDLDPQVMIDTLPGFHITPNYLDRYHRVLIDRKVAMDNPDSRYCAEFISVYWAIAGDLEKAKSLGQLRLKVTHGDPKLNNFLFDIRTRQVVSLIDLDTVKPGLWHYDIGDCLRSCCHRQENDEFDIEIASACLKGYLSETRVFFSQSDYTFLYPAIRLIPFELGLRFFTDYLEGNRYFKVTEPSQNLHRAVAQFRLCSSILAQEKSLSSLIDQYNGPESS